MRPYKQCEHELIPSVYFGQWRTPGDSKQQRFVWTVVLWQLVSPLVPHVVSELRPEMPRPKGQKSFRGTTTTALADKAAPKRARAVANPEYIVK